MKLSSLYSNKEDIFPTITFNEDFNVVFAQVESPEDKNKDSHNLGKTFLITVIDYMLLGQADKRHPFKLHKVFANFVFFLEIQTNSGKFVTIKRKVTGTKSISIHTLDEQHKQLNKLVDAGWEYSEKGLEKARKILDSLVNLSAIEPYRYRKGLGYILRRQQDYDEVFRISRFRSGKDKDWKPFMAILLGLDHDLISEKYELESRVNGLEKARDVLEKEANSKKEKFDELRGEIEIKTAALEKLRTRVDNFSFQEIEAEISENTLRENEAELSRLNEQRYVIDYEVEEIQQSLETEFEFDVERIQSIFEEAQLVFPENLKRGYNDLVEFNRKLSSGRIERLRSLSKKLLAQRLEIETRIIDLDKQRQAALEILKEKETFDKYKSLQKRLSNSEREVIILQQRLEQLGRAASIQKEINEEKKTIDSTVEKISNSLHGDNLVYSTIRRTFNEYVERVLNVKAILFVETNQQGNPEFKVSILDEKRDGKETSEGRGTSYKKILCACFDLALLSVHAPKSFYRFAYHDGIFEGLDNRKKVNLLNLVREICEQKKIQYILTVIDSDLPRDSIDQKLLFESSEIIRKLHDKDDSGRLFRMPAF